MAVRESPNIVSPGMPAMAVLRLERDGMGLNREGFPNRL